MNRPISFFISLAGHMGCVGLLFLTSKPWKEKPFVMEICRVTLFAPGKPASSSPPGAPPAKSAGERPTVKKAEPAPKPVFVTRRITRPSPRPREERAEDFKQLAKLEKEALPRPPSKGIREDGDVGKLSVSGDGGSSYGGSSSYDALIGGVVKSNWTRPSRAVVGDNPPCVSVAIRIALDGRITQSQVTKSSGISLLDASAVKAIEKSNPLPLGLPSYIGGRYYDVTIIFQITDEA